MCHVAPRPQLKADPMSMRTFSPNHALHLTAYSVRSSVAPASRQQAEPPAFGSARREGNGKARRDNHARTIHSVHTSGHATEGDRQDRPIGCIVCLALGLCVAPRPRRRAAASARAAGLGWAWTLCDHAGSRRLAAFLDGLRALGCVDGQTIALEYRWAEGRVDRLPALAAELVGLPLDVLVIRRGRPQSARPSRPPPPCPSSRRAMPEPCGA